MAFTRSLEFSNERVLGRARHRDDVVEEPPRNDVLEEHSGVDQDHVRPQDPPPKNLLDRALREVRARYIVKDLLVPRVRVDGIEEGLHIQGPVRPENRASKVLENRCKRRRVRLKRGTHNVLKLNRRDAVLLEEARRDRQNGRDASCEDNKAHDVKCKYGDMFTIRRGAI